MSSRLTQLKTTTALLFISTLILLCACIYSGSRNLFNSDRSARGSGKKNLVLDIKRNTLWVSHWNTSEISSIHPGSGSVMRTYPLNSKPFRLFLDSFSSKLLFQEGSASGGEVEAVPDQGPGEGGIIEKVPLLEPGEAVGDFLSLETFPPKAPPEFLHPPTPSRQ